MSGPAASALTSGGHRPAAVVRHGCLCRHRSRVSRRPRSFSPQCHPANLAGIDPGCPVAWPNDSRFRRWSCTTKRSTPPTEGARGGKTEVAHGSSPFASAGGREWRFRPRGRKRLSERSERLAHAGDFSCTPFAALTNGDFSCAETPRHAFAALTNGDFSCAETPRHTPSLRPLPTNPTGTLTTLATSTSNRSTTHGRSSCAPSPSSTPRRPRRSLARTVTLWEHWGSERHRRDIGIPRERDRCSGSFGAGRTMIGPTWSDEERGSGGRTGRRTRAKHVGLRRA